MKMQITALLFALLVLFGCAPAVEPAPPAQAEVLSQAQDEALSPEEQAHRDAVAEIAAGLEECTPREAVLAYLELQYLGYINLLPVDLGAVLDLRFLHMYNLGVWQEHLTQRRRLLRELDLCHVETERYPYTVRFIGPEELSDPRLDYWEGYDFMDSAGSILHFVVEGEPGKAYPPLMAVNGEQTIRLRREGKGWRVTFVYFPGAVHKFYDKGLMEPREDSSARAALLKEFAPYRESAFSPDTEPNSLTGDGTSNNPLPAEANPREYNGLYAARYARAFTETPNPEFYHIGDWRGNCMNFVCQCILYGFGSGGISGPVPWDYMDRAWFAGSGGGSLAWESVNYFWDFATGDGPLRSQPLKGISQAAQGDVIQIRSIYTPENEDSNDFSHCLLVVDQDTLLLAQNSPSNFVYYSDLVNIKTRILRPVSLAW